MTTSPEPVPGRESGDALRGAVLRGAGIILVVTVVARIAGFVRYLVFGTSVGAGDVGTAYATANLLPNVLFEVVAGGALAAVVVPLVAGLVSREAGSETADRIVSSLLTWTVLGTGALAALVVVFAEPIAGFLLTSDVSEAAGVLIGARLLRIFALQLPLYGISVVLGAYLQARKSFLWPAMMPLISSLVVMASYRVYAALVPPVATSTTISDAAVGWLGWGTTAGVAAMTLPVTIASLRAGLRVRPMLRMPSGFGRRALALGGAGLGAIGAQQLVLGLILVLSMRAGGTGTLPVFQYAQALYLLPYAVLVVPLVTAVFPHLSELRLVGNGQAFAKVAGTSLRTVTAIAMIGGAMLFAGGPALEQFFRHLDRAGAAGVGSATAALALGLAGYAIATQCTRVLSAALRARDALLVGSVGWGTAGLLIVITVLSSPTRSAAEAATGFGVLIAIGMILSAVVGLHRVRDIVEPGGHWAALLRIALLSPIALLVGAIPGMLLGKWLVTTETGQVGAVLAGIASGLVALVLTGLTLLASDPQLAGDLRTRMRRRRRRNADTGVEATEEQGSP